MRIAILAAAVLAGCAATPQQMAQESNWNVCRYTMGGPHSQVAHNEARRRGLDCAPMYPAIAAKLQAENAAVANFQRAINPPAPMIPFPTQTNCRSVYRGYGIYDTVCN